MENAEKYGRFSSCRGVAFEIKPHADLFAIPAPATNLPNNNGTRRSRLPWGSLSRVFPSSRTIDRSISRTSSHFCDLEDEDDADDDDNLVDIEEGHEVERVEQKPFSLPPALSKREKPPAKSGASATKQAPKARLSVILLDQGLFTIYKRLFLVCLVLNTTGLVLAATGKFPYARNRAALFSIANIFALVLCRSEAFLRIVFWLAVNILGWSFVPLRIKTTATSFLQSVGGIHSGCGVSSIAWLIYALVLTLQDRENTSPEIIYVSSAILALLCMSALAAFPLVRHLHHNVFERTHRFAGWTSLLLLWIFIILTVSYDPETKSYTDNIGSIMIKRQEFWFTVAITSLIIVPWLTVRRVPVRVSSPSGHATIIKFDGGVEAGLLGRISPSPFSEWHAFGIISDNKKEHLMLAGAVGDYTKSLVSNPPTHLWVRRVHFAGLPYLTNMYNKVLLVATGSGICVFLSFLIQPCKADVCVLWVTKNVEQNFGEEIKVWMSGHPKEKVIVHDTAVLGRPNVAQLSVETAKNWGAEVVLVTSNPEGSRDIVGTCKANGIAAFGPIWDS
ncbi:hypothetical protein F511_34432 [Dorcoceras hygrometricum]|uniref:Adenylate-forming reductase n=1 Tax=Dorcoceras hygrometricum TaxID=472368 RepID=A0A2Z7CCJ9_9LAMI|nr:hypothetical protein F511_34432 [Dorcoceras hygrometricum]